MRLKGGNAADAAVATVLCLGIANPASSGFGGGSFILVRSNRSHFESKMNEDSASSGSSSKIPPFEDARETTDDNSNHDGDGDDVDFMTEVIDCRETAPKKSYRDMYNGLPDEASSIGGLSIAVPGELKGLELLHSRHGSLKWSEVVEPSRVLARDGVIISKHLASDIKSLFTNGFIRHGDFPGIRHYLSNRSYNNNSSSSSSDFEYLSQGEILRNPALAETLKQVQEEGADAFYTGEIARKLVTDIQQSGGIVTVEDMEDYRATIRSPVRADVAGFTVVGVGPPSSGGAAVIGALRFLSGYQTPFAANADTLSKHRMVEAMRHVFSIRMSLSDPAYSNSTIDAVNDLIRGDYMDTLRAITKDNDTLPLSTYGGSKWAQMHDVDSNQDDNGTSHLSVVDKDGNSVAITTSINNIFGSLVFSESTGVLLGDTMDDFGVPGKSNFYGLKPSKSNFITPGKRPLSSMSPTMIYRKEVILNICFLGMPVFDAVSRPRIHDQLAIHDAFITATEKSIVGENGPTLEVSRRTKDALLNRGHSQLLDIDYTGCVQAIFVDHETHTLSAVSDIRKGGFPAGW
ncbi:gamma-glutamyltransferase [Fragilariopsis cylindrus CCMP1102]|uniref:Gamma-glutamyltransferase n=1 Tax=Fragilariopsis cylindrus CCMP1102 TaxID=635003 RepID=A0A1E7EPH3_9STRA|nr:gamma-glutamyltransferase [Fragilariopsis cylindrus CCMP1102]|eukprot:OEU07849.1 gamma-glutamyltransferase [Fragilariopsis cylindrus CCMP1102]